MPEVTWKYRRVFAYGRTLIYSALLTLVIMRMEHADATHLRVLREIALTLCAMQTLDAFLYMCGATATDITRLFKAVRWSRRALGKPS